MKKALTIVLTFIMLLNMSVPAFATAKTANPTTSTVYINGAAKAFEAYSIDGNNYFKLRDLAFVLNGTNKQFDVGYDSNTKAIALTSGTPYAVAGGEMSKGDGKAKTATPTASKIYLDGKALNLTVYTIGGNNFFKLRDLMQALDVYVGYDNTTKVITVDTSKRYETEGAAQTTTPAQLTTYSSASVTNAISGDKRTVTITDEPVTKQDGAGNTWFLPAAAPKYDYKEKAFSSSRVFKDIYIKQYGSDKAIIYDMVACVMIDMLYDDTIDYRQDIAVIGFEKLGTSQ